MAVDPHAPPGPAKPDLYSPIENEIPTYRAISPMAITSFVLGLLAVVTFASLYFLAAGVGAVVTGALADRKIRRMPDVLTGRGFAQTGIALGLIFSLSAVTFTFVRDFKVYRSAEQFARSYAEVLAAGDLADAYWYRLTPNQRKGNTPKKVLADLTAQSTETDPAAYEMRVGALKQAIDALGSSGGSVRFVEIERAGFQDLTPYALAILEIQGGVHDHDHDHDADDHDHDHDLTPTTEYMMVELRSLPDSPVFDWYVNEVAYPYTRNSFTLAPKPIDDGHGHSH